MKTTLLSILAIATILLPVAATRAQEADLLRLNPKRATPKEWQRLVDFLDRQSKNSLNKTTGEMREIRSLIIRGNKITTVVYNYGNIARPNTLRQRGRLGLGPIGIRIRIRPPSWPLR